MYRPSLMAGPLEMRGETCACTYLLHTGTRTDRFDMSVTSTALGTYTDMADHGLKVLTIRMVALELNPCSRYVGWIK